MAIMDFSITNFIEPGAFAESWVKGKMANIVKELFNEIGEERLVWMIDNEKDLSEFIKPELNPTAYKWAAEIINNSDVVHAIPDWAIEVIDNHGGKGVEWTKRQMSLVRGMIGG